MKIEVLDNKKVKVTLTVEDLIYYNLKPEKLSAQSPKLQKFLFNIMDNVRRETGFNPYMGAVAVEAVQSGEGIVLYISGLNVGDSQAKNVTINGETKRIKVFCRKNVSPQNSYMFDDFSDVCSVLINLSNDSLEVSRIYKYEKSWYFLLGACDGFERAHCMLTEYCTGYGGMLLSETFLKEHGEIIAEGSTLVSMAEGIRKLNDK